MRYLRARRGRAGDGAATAAPSALPAAEQREAAREAALRLLAVRERSRAELRSRLRRKGFERGAVEAVLSRLFESGLQDDRRFAERFASDAAARGFAARHIHRELLARGLDPELAAVTAAEAERAEEDRARALAEGKIRSTRGLSQEARARRIASLLGRRGYDRELCDRIARDVTRADRSDDEEDLP